MMAWIPSPNAGMLSFTVSGRMANAIYKNPSDSCELTLTVDNPMVEQLAMMLGNSAMIAQMGGQLERINRTRFLREDRSLRAIIGNRILVTAEDADSDVMIPVVEGMDFRVMKSFNR